MLRKRRKTELSTLGVGAADPLTVEGGSGRNGGTMWKVEGIPQFPQRFGSIQDSRAFCQDFFFWYNKEHRHSGIALMTPEQVHYGRADEVTRHRASILAAAFEEHPNRFKNKIPVPDNLPAAVWINPPSVENIGA